MVMRLFIFAVAFGVAFVAGWMLEEAKLKADLASISKEPQAYSLVAPTSQGGGTPSTGSCGG